MPIDQTRIRPRSWNTRAFFITSIAKENMKTITDLEADEWIAGMKPEQVRTIVQEWHALKQALCAQILSVPTGADDWVDRAIHAANRARRAEGALRKLIYDVENSSATARNEVRETTCTNCIGTGRIGDHSCCVCHGTGSRCLS